MPASTTTVLQVSMGQAHACAVAEDGQTYCWGDSEYGRLGDGAAIRRLTPWRVLPLEDFPPVAPDRSLVF